MGGHAACVLIGIKMTNLLGLLRAMQIHYHMLHWQAHGPNFGSDHKMYKTIYKSVADEIDTWAEKTVFYSGPQSVSNTQVLSSINYWIARWAALKSEAEIAVTPELDFQAVSQKIIADLKQSGKLSFGVDDFIMSSCNKHERNLYMLQQRFDLQKI